MINWNESEVKKTGENLPKPKGKSSNCFCTSNQPSKTQTLVIHYCKWQAANPHIRKYLACFAWKITETINYWNSCRFILYKSPTDYSSICCSSDSHSDEMAKRLLHLSQCDHTTMTSNWEWWRCSWAESTLLVAEWCRGPDHGQILK